MHKKSKNLTDSKQLRRAAWLAFLSLAWLQVSSASHQFDHVAGDIADSCHVCVQLERVDDTVADSSTATIGLARADTVSQPLLANAIGHRFVAGPEARAPPQL